MTMFYKFASISAASTVIKMQRIAGNLAARAKVRLNVTPVRIQRRSNEIELGNLQVRAQSGAVEKIEVFVDNKKILVDPGMTILQVHLLLILKNVKVIVIYVILPLRHLQITSSSSRYSRNSL